MNTLNKTKVQLSNLKSPYMKPFLQCLAIVLVVFTMVKCGTEPEPEPEPPKELVVSGNINVFPTSIKSGETVTVSWDKLVNVTKVTINDIPVSISDGSKTYTLTNTTTFTVKFIGSNDKTYETTFTVNVAPDPNKARTDSLCLNKYWKLVSIKALLLNGTWGSDPLSAEQLSSKGFFYPNGTIESFDVNGKLDGNGKWAWYDKNSIIWNNVTITPYKLTKDSLILYDRNGTIVTTYKWYPL